MHQYADELRKLQPEHGFLIGVDSDGCAFDTMEIKHKECFIPNIINSWDLQAVSKYARETAEFVNLYSKSRGVNRFPALLQVMDLLAQRPEVQQRGTKLPELDSLRRWVQEETRLGNPALAAHVAQNGDPVLRRALDWSTAVNDAIGAMVRHVPPFPYVKESLEKAQAHADILVVSATPVEALAREWEEHQLTQYVKVIGGQEMGTKKEILAMAKAHGYEEGHVLMIGDALGDLQAAKDNGVLFYPINPGDEERSWQHFYEETVDAFFRGEYAGEYEARMIAEFAHRLPEQPPWK